MFSASELCQRKQTTTHTLVTQTTNQDVEVKYVDLSYSLADPQDSVTTTVAELNRTEVPTTDDTRRRG